MLSSVLKLINLRLQWEIIFRTRNYFSGFSQNKFTTEKYKKKIYKMIKKISWMRNAKENERQRIVHSFLTSMREPVKHVERESIQKVYFHAISRIVRSFSHMILHPHYPLPLPRSPHPHSNFLQYLHNKNETFDD